MAHEIRIGLLGFGSMGRTHTWCVTNIPFFFKDLPFKAAITALCTAHPDKAREMAATYGIPKVYAHEDELIEDPEIDVIDICTPNNCHFETLKKAIKAGKHIYCEKPLCFTAEQADEINELVKGRHETYGVVFHNRFFAGMLRAKQLIDEGKLGRILQFRVDYLHDSCLDVNKKAGWKQDATICGGGVLYDLGSHALDLLTHLVGPMDTVTGQSQIAFPTRTDVHGQTGWTTNADEAFYMMLKAKNGAMGTVTVSKISNGTNDDLSLYIGGDKGAIRWSLMDEDFLEFYDSTKDIQPLGGERGYTRIACVSRFEAPSGFFPSPKAPAGWLRAHLQSYYTFLSHVDEQTPHNPSFENGTYIQHLMQDAYESAQDGVTKAITAEVPPCL